MGVQGTTGRILTDASSARAIAQRDGVGRLRHVDVRFLWLQDKIKKGYFKIIKVPGAENPADLGTKFLNYDLMVRYSKQMGCRAIGNATWGDREDTEEVVSNIAGIYNGMVALPKTNRHAVWKMLLTAATLAGCRESQ